MLYYADELVELHHDQRLAGDESDVAELYSWIGPFTRISGPGVPA